jgi:hypothetical protein
LHYRLEHEIISTRIPLKIRHIENTVEEVNEMSCIGLSDNDLVKEMSVKFDVASCDVVPKFAHTIFSAQSEQCLIEIDTWLRQGNISLLFGSFTRFYTITCTHPLLGNGLVNKLPRRQILGKQSVDRSRNNRTNVYSSLKGNIKRANGLAR